MVNKVIIKVLVLLVVVLQSCSIFNINNGELVGYDVNIATEKDILKRIPKEARHFFDDMRFIPRVSQQTQNYNNSILTDKDTTIVQFTEHPLSFQPRILSVPAFYMSDHEVTNNEYFEFVDWVTNYTARKLLAQKYPDEYLVAGTDLLKKNQTIRMEQIILDNLFYVSENSMSSRLYYHSLYDTVQTHKLIYEYKYYDRKIVNGRIFLEEKTKSVPIYPNTICWTEEFPQLDGSESMSQHYFTHPAYYNHPVVGISYEQALAYCDWRTNRLNEAILLKEKVDIGEAYFTLIDFDKKDSLNEYGYLLLPSFELPSVNEWQLAAGSNYIDPDFAFKNKTMFDENGQYLANFGRIVDENNYLVKDYFEKNPNESVFTSSVKTFPANDNQLYDMNGNVAEWTSSNVNFFIDFEQYNPKTIGINDSIRTYKIVKGGSWADGPMYLRWRTNTCYKKQNSSSRIGFRVLMNIGDNSNNNTYR